MQLGRTCKTCGADDWYQRPKIVCRPCQKRRTQTRSRAHRADPAYTLWESAQTRAQYQMVPFAIGVEDVRKVWPLDGLCPVFGLPLRPSKHFADEHSPTLDRINPEWGYEVGNIAVISMKANRAKGRLTADELQRIVSWMRRQGLH